MLKKIACIFSIKGNNITSKLILIFSLKGLFQLSSSLSHSLSLNLRERSDTNQLQPTSIYICMYISKPSYKSLNICGNNNITTPHTHNLSICCFLMKLFPSIMKHFNTNRPFTYTRCSMCSTLSFSENIAIMPILHPYYSCTS